MPIVVGHPDGDAKLVNDPKRYWVNLNVSGHATRKKTRAL